MKNFLISLPTANVRARVSHVAGVVTRVEVSGECIAGQLDPRDWRLICDRVSFLAGPQLEPEFVHHWADVDRAYDEWRERQSEGA